MLFMRDTWCEFRQCPGCSFKRHIDQVWILNDLNGWYNHQWKFQDPKMEVLYHIRPYFGGIFPCIGLTEALYMVGTSNLGSWNGHWNHAQSLIDTHPPVMETMNSLYFPIKHWNYINPKSLPAIPLAWRANTVHPPLRMRVFFRP